MSTVLRVGNCSGFYGDRLSAMRELLEGGELDVITGDYLAELTMLILGRDLMRDPSLGYARTFVKQVEDSLGLALESGVKIVSNAGGLNPAGLASRLEEVAAALGLSPRIAYVDGDNLIDRAEELGLAAVARPLTANAYLGGFGIASALTNGADIVVTGRVTDASVVVGPAIAHFGWGRTAYDELAGAVVAGHVIECGTQATGGNFSGFRSMFRAGMDLRPLGFPVAEIAADGSCVITKQDGTGGLVSVDTVTAQLVYEVQSSRYLGPDVTTRLDTVSLVQESPDRVRISGVRGEAPPATTKVCLNELGGFRNQAEFVLVGLDIEAKADWVRLQVEHAFSASGNRPASVEWSLARTDHEDAASEEAASARLRVTVRDPSADRVGKAFTGPVVELALASYPGFTLTAPPAAGTPYGIYRAGYVAQSDVSHRVHLDGDVIDIAPPVPADPSETAQDLRSVGAEVTAHPAVPARRVPLGTVAHARSGDKGGDANIGLWAIREGLSPERARAREAWLLGAITPGVVRRLVPEAEGLDIEVHRLSNLGAVNVVIHGLLGEGVAASSRFDPQAKGLGEWVRSRHLDIPEELL